MTTPLYVRNAESNAVRQLTPEQAARCVLVVNNNYRDTAGVISGTIFGGDVNDAGGHTVYSLAFDRWYDPNNYASAEAADASFAEQGEKPHTEPAQWWIDPTTGAMATTTTSPAAALSAATGGATTSTTTSTTGGAANLGNLTSSTATPTTAPSATSLTLTTVQHAETKSLLKTIEAGAVTLGDDVVHDVLAAVARLKELLQHHRI